MKNGNVIVLRSFFSDHFLCMKVVTTCQNHPKPSIYIAHSPLLISMSIMFHECHLWSIDCSEKSAPPYSASDKCAAAPPRKQISSLQPVSQWGYTCMDIRDISWHSWHCIYWNLLRLDLFFFDPGKTMACPLWSSSAATTWVAIHSKQRMSLILHKLTSLKRMKRQWLFHLDLFFTAYNFVVFNFWILKTDFQDQDCPISIFFLHFRGHDSQAFTKRHYEAIGRAASVEDF